MKIRISLLLKCILKSRAVSRCGVVVMVVVCVCVCVCVCARVCMLPTTTLYHMVPWWYSVLTLLFTASFFSFCFLLLVIVQRS
jgi:hypothetical protein